MPGACWGSVLVNRNARAAAAKLLQQLNQGRSLSVLFEGGMYGIPAAESALVKEFCFGVARWRPQLEALSELLLKHPLKPKDDDVGALILLGLYQLLHTRVAPHAALAETVEASRILNKPWASGLINAVLRRFQREREALLERINRQPEARYAYPAWLLQRLRQAWPDHWEQFVPASIERPPMSLRVNLRRTSRQAVAALLESEGLAAEPIPWVESGLVLNSAVSVEALPGFKAGLVSVQDGGAQLAAGLLDPAGGDLVLDCCAAPGGKSGHLLEWADGVNLVAVDIDAQRIRRVRDNLSRLALAAELCQGDASHPSGDWGARRYDRILLDVPCTATGVIRRHPDIKLLRKAGDIDPLVRIQQRILRATWPLLKPGGILLYTTCSLLPEENHLQVASFLETQKDARERVIDAEWGHVCSVGRQTLPGENTMDGFYYACLEKC